MEDVHRAGGIMAILGELEHAGHIDTTVHSVLGLNLGAVLSRWDYRRSGDPEVHRFYCAAPGGKRTVRAYSQDARWDSMDLDRSGGCIRDMDHPYSEEGGLAVLFGNIAERGCIVKTGAVRRDMYQWHGTARVFDQQETALNAIDGGEIEPNTAVIIRYEGPKGGPGMQEMLKPTMSLKAQKVDDSCALITDGRYSGATAGLSIGHVSPEAANGGALALVEDGDTIEIDIPARRIHLAVSDETLAMRRAAMEALPAAEAWQPRGERTRVVTRALKAYAAFATSADRGGLRAAQKNEYLNAWFDWWSRAGLNRPPQYRQCRQRVEAAYDTGSQRTRLCRLLLAAECPLPPPLLPRQSCRWAAPKLDTHLNVPSVLTRVPSHSWSQPIAAHWCSRLGAAPRAAADLGGPTGDPAT
jgi:dihydroxy-acid dehydratase